MIIPFEKYHGLGNDFILCEYEPFKDWDAENLEKLIVSICNRHTGIGADGFILVKRDPVEMIYYNQDGSRASMCGNGLRCFTLYLYQHDGAKDWKVNTLAGLKEGHVLDHSGDLIRVDLAKPLFDVESLALATDELPWKFPLEIDGQVYEIWCIFMNTIHTVLFVEDLDSVDVETLGKKICHHPLFKEQTNVNFVEITGDHSFKARTYERGCGPTLACGTGMAASAVISKVVKGLPSPMNASLELGNLEISVAEDNNVCLTGPAKRIAKGDFYYD